MRVTLEMSKGEKRSFNLPLSREEEKKLLKKIDERQDDIATMNTLTAVIQVLRG